MNEHQLSELLDKYLDGTCTSEEKQAIDNWFELHENEPGFTENLPEDKKEQLKRRMFNAISRRDNVNTPKSVIKPLYKSRWLKIAAAAVLLVFAKVIIIDTLLAPAKFIETAAADMVITNRTKNIIKQLLPDSSVVWLSPEASLSYPKVFRAASRNVTMQGECFFEVTKNARRPFIISSEHIVTKVWGTSFRVLDMKNIATAIVTVITGKVSVSKKGSDADRSGAKLAAGEVMLLPKEEVVYSKNTDLLTASRQADISALNIYKHIDLSFENARLTEIVDVLNRKFDAHIKIQNEVLNKAVMTADLTGLNLPEVLEVLKASMKLNYEVTNDLIVLKKTN
ncbi:FecR family protein [Mucilaginibacter ginsenosidivorax]|uniref:FecR family protein n=1 Tax=Mucilaginibacter ginsenosidivorax TaxID=862126 RepID=A0A5B8W3Z0_9SPHI|nr:FecR family protein [Mucilaginibacter ginsenosidivorax]QEC78544.1 FecR family protein [Mucilaginibacter ginsenosidivorax]